MKNKKVKVAFKQPNKELEVIEINTDYDTLKKLVGGFIEYCYSDLIGEGITVIINEEGKLLGLENNFSVKEYNDFIVGNAIFIKEYYSKKLKDVVFIDLTEEDIQKIKNWIESQKTKDTEFTKWLDAFLEEKEIDLNEFVNIQNNFCISMIQISNIVEFIKNNEFIQNKVKNDLILLDLNNQSIKNYLIWLGEQIYKL